MATKRMFARLIIESGEFEDLSAKAQMIYIRMNLIADDDGFAEGGSPMRTMEGTQDDLDELEAQGFIVKVPGKKRLYHIKDWMIHNTLDKTKYNPSPYKGLLQSLYPNKGEYISKLPAWERPKTDENSSSNSPVPNGYRLGTDSVPQVSSSLGSGSDIDLGKIQDNGYVVPNSNVIPLNNNTSKSICCSSSSYTPPTIEEVEEYFNNNYNDDLIEYGLDAHHEAEGFILYNDKNGWKNCSGSMHWKYYADNFIRISIDRAKSKRQTGEKIEHDDNPLLKAKWY